MAHSTYAKGAGGFGGVGDAVNIDFVMNFGSRAQRRRLARHLKREETKTTAAPAKKKAKGKNIL